MVYLNEEHIRTLGVDWGNTIDAIEEAVYLIEQNEYVQPIKSYLRFNDLNNRIIAMPAYLGGKFDSAGLKWIASFPGNISRGIPRAHSVTILNDPEAGVPGCVINSARISGIRTAGVSGCILRNFFKMRNRPQRVGIIGFGPIGQLHFEMILSEFKHLVTDFYVYDQRAVELSNMHPGYSENIQVCRSWEEVFNLADIFITCTASEKRYVNKPPQRGSLHLNVSLRDYDPVFRTYADCIIVDDWDEVCRENTDVYLMHQSYQLERHQVFTMADVVCRQLFHSLAPEAVVMFNPMGMAIFDIAIATLYFAQARERKIGVAL